MTTTPKTKNKYFIKRNVRIPKEEYSRFYGTNARGQVILPEVDEW